ncbi:MAG TPA: GNAT family N-acetyltransferase [Flavobacteriales bacterium]|nr:GNAT family N-acetyltransferase [Flavobacteriales bacterium]
MKHHEPTIRFAETDDLSEMQALFVDTISVICKNDYSPEQLNVWTTSVENTQRWINKLTTQFLLVALVESKIVGYASLENNDYFDFLYVHKNYQKQGIASRLYSEIETEAMRRKSTVLYADVSLTAQAFFKKRGFMVLQTRLNKIQGVEITNFKMVKHL